MLHIFAASAPLFFFIFVFCIPSHLHRFFAAFLIVFCGADSAVDFMPLLLLPPVAGNQGLI